ncbi:3-phosphoshikimate 1-carboxyvinyltransferase [Candidatus Pelagibacter sp. HIMB1485]|uniref:3-phosphoshikimate 1-carboxyvinyltransferase n=1 Tax=Candidatus Pelagibacter sp. HIMB1485 TaxID=3415415 RepID=UPI003F8423F7
MSNIVKINNKIENFKKTIKVPGDKSLSIRWVLFASLSSGKSKAKNLLMSEDVMATIYTLRKLGIKILIKKKECIIFGKGIDGYKYKKNLILDAKNSGTLGRLILGLLVNSTKPIKLIGDKSLSKRDFLRVCKPLSKFGAKFKLKDKKFLPLKICGSSKLKPIKYNENRGSAQCKSSVMFAAMRTEGTTIIKAKKSRNHTELLCKHLRLPISIKSHKNFDEIKIKKIKKIKTINYNIPSDISSSAFFIVLTALTKNSELTIKNVNINPSRTGIIDILKKMGVKIEFKKQKIYKGEKKADIRVVSAKNIKAINCPTKFNSGAIDEFLVIFLVAAKAKGISYFKNLSELNQKESPRLKWAEKILANLGIKTITTNHSIKIYGNPNLNLDYDKKIIIKNYLKDHRVFMTSLIAALTFGGRWTIHDKDSINTSFPNFLKIIKNIKSA